MKRAVIAGAVALIVSGCGSAASTNHATPSSTSSSSSPSTTVWSEPPSTINRAARGEIDACTVMTQQDAAGYAGNAVRAPKGTSGGGGCYWAAESGLTSILIDFVTGDTGAAFTESRQNLERTGATVTNLPDIGDDGFVAESQNPHSVNASVINGGHRARVIMTGPNASPKTATEILGLAVVRAFFALPAVS